MFYTQGMLLRNDGFFWICNLVDNPFMGNHNINKSFVWLSVIGEKLISLINWSDSFVLTVLSLCGKKCMLRKQDEIAPLLKQILQKRENYVQTWVTMTFGCKEIWNDSNNQYHCKITNYFNLSGFIFLHTF